MVFLVPRDSTSVSTNRWAWHVCWMLFASTTLNYMDRQSMSLVGEDVRAEFRIDHEGFGWVLAAFQLTYALFQVPAGYLADRWDVRKVYAFAVGCWSLAAILVAFSPTLSALLAFRALLGIAESFNWPCALKITATVLPPESRSLGNGIFNSGAAIGAVVTPLIVPPLANYFGWRTAFVIVGLLGFVWVVLWPFVVNRDPHGAFGETHPEPVATNQNLSNSGLSLRAVGSFGLIGLLSILIAATAPRFGLNSIWWSIAFLMFGLLAVARLVPLSELKGRDWARSMGEIVRLRRFWVLVIMACSVNVSWHFLVNWMATLFKTDLSMPYLIGGMASAIPFLAADLGNLGGGWFSRFLSRRGERSDRARAKVILVSCLFIGLALFVGRSSHPALTILILALVAFGTAAYMANYFAFCQEVSPRYTGLVVGVLGALGNLFAAGFLPIAGRIKDQTGSFSSVFVVVGLLPLLGILAVIIGWGWGPQGEGEADSIQAN
ncbi:MFS transporter [Isosphaeraceae bacterium EP7]